MGIPRIGAGRRPHDQVPARPRPRLTPMQRLDRLERVTDLLLVLLDAPRPLSLREIADRVPGYPDTHGARRQAFERDKRLLRDEGVPVLVVPIGGDEQLGYRVDPDSYYLPDLGLEAEEQAALNLAVAGVHLGEPIGRDALLKLGAGRRVAAPIRSRAPGRSAVGGRAAGAAGALRRHPPGCGGPIRLPGRAPPRGRGRAPVPQRPLVPDRVRPRPGRGPHLPGRPDRRDPRDRRAGIGPRCPPTSTWTLPSPATRGSSGTGRRSRSTVLVDGAESGRVVAELGARGGGRAPGRRRGRGAPGGDRPGGPHPLGARSARPRRGHRARRRAGRGGGAPDGHRRLGRRRDGVASGDRPGRTRPAACAACWPSWPGWPRWARPPSTRWPPSSISHPRRWSPSWRWPPAAAFRPTRPTS